jgi:hypothetical protein
MAYHPQRETIRFVMRNESFLYVNDFNGLPDCERNRVVSPREAVGPFSFASAPGVADFRGGLREPDDGRRGFRR